MHIYHTSLCLSDIIATHCNTLQQRLKEAAEESRQQFRTSAKKQSALKEEAVGKVRDFAKEWGDRERCVAVCCSVLQCVAVRCSVLQCVAVCCSVLQNDLRRRV